MKKERWYTLAELKSLDTHSLFNYYLVSAGKMIRNADKMAEYEVRKTEKALLERLSNECLDFLKTLDDSKRYFMKKENYERVREINSIEKRFHENILGDMRN